TAADIVFTLQATGEAASARDFDTVRLTAVRANLIAHRTGGKLGDVVAEDIENSGNPNAYMILTNRDFEQGLPLAGRDFDDEVAMVPPLFGPEGQQDDDLARIILERLPIGLSHGSVSLELSHPESVRIFRNDGTMLSASEWSADLSSDEYLAGMSSGPVALWLEGLSKVADFTFAISYEAPSGVTSSDDVHMLIAEWTFIGSDGDEVPFVSPMWLDALLAATDAPIMPLQDPTGAFYKIQIDGLAPHLVTQLRVASDSTTDSYTESYAAGDFDTSLTDKTVSRRFGAIYSAADVLYAPDDPVVTDEQRTLIRQTLGLNVVHNEGLTATIVTPWDTQSDYLKKHGQFQWSLQGDQRPAYKVGDTIRGSVTWPTQFFPKWNSAIGPVSPILFVVTDEAQPQVTPLKWSHDGTTLDFEFTARIEGLLRLVFSQRRGEMLVGPVPSFQLSSILVRITADGTLPKWEERAWNALKLDDGFVPGDPINRNRQITTKYADMFNSGRKPGELNPFEWFGMAAFASRLAGDGMHTAMSRGYAPLPNNPPFDWIPANTQKVFRGLADGNLAIFIDMYKAGLAYRDGGGIAEIRAMNASGEVSNEQIRAWKKIDQGLREPRSETIWQGVEILVNVEQRDLLQQVLDKDPDLWQNATDNVGSKLSRIFMISSPFPGDESTFQDYRANPDGPAIPSTSTFYDVEARMTWILSRMPKWREGWRATHDFIEIPTLLKGDYNRLP
ncbi:MAG: hypothetical protein SGJ07_10740, partial [Rhodospirillaceae bacterium]|nr:hypothetical protein [Rhodospirillaceae bacterium]